MTESKRPPNKLIQEKSPYLLQHAYNPVDWHPWGEEAFQKAREEDKPIFLSIGYSTCHWCHVMERETFEDKAAARDLNDWFVSVKVDREERPDIDHIYMDVCQAMSGSGGWPLSVFMDADKRPFFAGTYYTNEQFRELCAHVRKIWDTQRGKLEKAAQSVLQHIHQKQRKPGKLDEGLPHVAYGELRGSFERKYGGFSGAPKFPSPHILLFLMEYAQSFGRPEALEMAEKTLDGMYRGGINDHIGNGFCRYSTDGRWLAPHFEKMLYDNALLAMTYAAAFGVTQKQIYRRIAGDTLHFLLRVLKSPEGGFYTALDADSEGVEGKYYLWTKQETERLLGADAEEFCRAYDITDRGNFEGKNIPNLIGNPLPADEIPDFSREKAALLAAREKRVPPFLDDKVLVCWNGLCMAAFAFAGRILGRETYVNTAEEIWRFIVRGMQDADGRLLSSWRSGEAGIRAHADDYAFLVWGLLELHAATLRLEFLSEAVRLNRQFTEGFWDAEAGGFYYTASDAEQLIARTKTAYDGAVPSANSVAAMNLLRLSRLTGDMELQEKAIGTMEAFAGELSSYPAAFAHMTTAVLKAAREQARVVLIGQTSESLRKMVEAAREANACCVALTGETQKNLRVYFEGYRMQDGLPTAYVCRGNMCLPPVTDEARLREFLKG